MNQIHLDPRHSRAEERIYDAEHGIVTESWSPIGGGDHLLAEPTIVELARRHSRTPAQIVLRWHVQLGLVPIPKTSRPSRMAENIDVFDFVLAEEDMRAIEELEGSGDDVVDSDRYGH
jgi:2,5-diketo-D-gluconate reductase A